MTSIRKAALIAVLVGLGGEVGQAQSLRGSRSSVDRMFSRAVRNDLEFLRTSKGIYEAVKDGELVMISVTSDMTLEEVGYPFVLPKTRDVLYAFAKKYHDACGERLVVTSAARPRTEQPRNASPKSVHPTGMAVDFRRPTGDCLTWMRKELVALERQGVLEATEEKRPVHFHVAVLQRGKFAPPAAAVAAATATIPLVVGSANGTVTVIAPESPSRPTANPAAQPLPLATVQQVVPTARPAAAAVPKTTSYVVRKGDSLSEIAKKFGTTTARLRSLNGLKNSTIRAGQRLRVN